jgi:hypothetical protein
MPSKEWIAPIEPGFVVAPVALPPPKPALLYCAGRREEGIRAVFTVPLAFDVLQRACLAHLPRTTNDSVAIIETRSSPPINGLVQYVVRVPGIDHLGELRLREMGEQQTEISFFTAVSERPTSTPAQSAAFLNSFTSSKTWEEFNETRKQIKAKRNQAYEQLCSRILHMQDVVFNRLIHYLNDDITAITRQVSISTTPPTVRANRSPEKERNSRGKNNDTHEKLDKLKELRRQKKSKRPRWINACDLAGIDPKTATKHEPDLKEHWNDED